MYNRCYYLRLDNPNGVARFVSLALNWDKVLSFIHIGLARAHCYKRMLGMTLIETQLIETISALQV